MSYNNLEVDSLCSLKGVMPMKHGSDSVVELHRRDVGVFVPTSCIKTTSCILLDYLRAWDKCKSPSVAKRVKTVCVLNERSVL